MPVLGPALEHDGDGVHERDLDVEDEEHERDEVKARVEIEPRRHERLFAALVRRELAPRRIGALANARHPRRHERREDEPRGHEAEEEDGGISREHA